MCGAFKIPMNSFLKNYRYELYRRVLIICIISSVCLKALIFVTVSFHVWYFLERKLEIMDICIYILLQNTQFIFITDPSSYRALVFSKFFASLGVYWISLWNNISANAYYSGERWGRAGKPATMLCQNKKSCSGDSLE